MAQALPTTRSTRSSGSEPLAGREPTDGKILTALRERTRSLHDRIERTVDLPTRLATLDRYRGLLARFYGYYAPLEQRLAQELPRLGGDGALEVDLAPRLKAPLLQKDLRSLGFEADAVARLPRCENLPEVAGVAGVLGCLYVLEGATLGGQIIRREVQRLYGLGTGSGCAFFTGSGVHVGERWMEFCGLLASYAGRNPHAEEAIVSSARETFTTFDRWVAGEREC